MSVASSFEIVRHVSLDDAPYVDTGINIELKLLRVDRASGVWVLANRFHPGARLQRHRHTGAVDGFTLSGRWHYLEYDWYSTAGSYIHEPANSVHTLDVPADNTEVTEVLWVISGALLNLADDDTVESITDGESVMEAYDALLQMAGLARSEHLID